MPAAQLSLVVDGGQLSDSRAGSTIVDLSSPGRYTVTRPGSAQQTVETTLARHGLHPR